MAPPERHAGAAATTSWVAGPAWVQDREAGKSLGMMRSQRSDWPRPRAGAGDCLSVTSYPLHPRLERIRREFGADFLHTRDPCNLVLRTAQSASINDATPRNIDTASHGVYPRGPSRREGYCTTGINPVARKNVSFLALNTLPKRTE